LSAALGVPGGVYGLAFLEDGTGAATFAGWDSHRDGVTEVFVPAPAGARTCRVYAENGALVRESEPQAGLALRINEHVQYVRFER